MNQDILSYIMNHAGSLSLQEILVNFIAAIAVGGVIFLSYRFSHSGAPVSYTHLFSHRISRPSFISMPALGIKISVIWLPPYSRLFTAATIFGTVGKVSASKMGLKGIGVLLAPNRLMGASK